MVKADRTENSQLESFVLNNIPKSTKISEVSSEATYLLPKDSSQYFSDFFKKFDQNLHQLGVTSYGVSMTTLEEVFLKVERDPEEDQAQKIEKIKRRMTSLQEEGKVEDEYSISKEQVQGGFAIFWLHFIALIIKRYIFSKRNLKGFVTDLFIPSALIIIGFGLATIDFFNSSSQRTLDVSLFPLDQRTLYNVNTPGGIDAPTDLINGLRNQNMFNFSTVTGTYADSSIGLESYDNDIYSVAIADPLKPYRYGNYFFHTINSASHQYKIATFANSTSQDSQVAFAALMYESILRKSIGDPSLTYTTINDPMPIVQIYKDRNKGSNSFFMSFVMGIALALVPTSIVGFLLTERTDQTLHQQIISGMNKISYWVSNYAFDVSKILLTSLFTIAFLYIYQLNVKWDWLFLLLLPFAMVPYTYCTSFLFDDEGGAMNFTIYHNFVIGGLFPTVVTVLRIIDSTRKIGDILIWIPRFHPLFCAINGFVNISTKDAIAVVRGVPPPNALNVRYVAGGDLIFLVFGIFFYTLLVVLIEMGAFN